MNFLIEGIVLFNSESKELYSVKSDLNNIVLSNYAARALELLILNNGTSIERGLFFQFLWGENETSASNASLNNYISEVRKALTLLGVDKTVIMTLPKYGFKLVANVEVEPNDIHEPNNTVPVNRNFSWLKWCFIVPGVMIALAALILLSHRFRVGTPDIDFSFTQGVCDFYLLNAPRVSVNDFKDAVNKESIECDKNPRDVFMTETREYGDIYNIRLISVCDRTERGYSNCVNIKRVFTNQTSLEN